MSKQQQKTDPINEAEYQRGRTMFDNGATLRVVVERVSVASASDDDAEFAAAMSLVLGFGDALLDRLRSKP